MESTDWIATCEDPEKLKTGMENARRHQRMDVYQAAADRLCDVESAALGLNCPIGKDFYKMLIHYENLLTDKNDRSTRATRTRQMLGRKNVVECLEGWALAKSETSGFRQLLADGKFYLTGEYIVHKHEKSFSKEAVANARKRLSNAGVNI